jgi:DNA-binding transcriptional MerR regulator
MPRKRTEIPVMNAAEDTFTITELSREFGITPRAIRYYEDQGLISPLRAGHARVYSKRDRTRLKLTLRGKRLGLSLAEIRDLIDLYDTAHDESTQLSHFLVSLSKRKATLQQQREDIEAVLSEIIALERQSRELLRKKEASSGGRRKGKKV